MPAPCNDGFIKAMLSGFAGTEANKNCEAPGGASYVYPSRFIREQEEIMMALNLGPGRG